MFIKTIVFFIYPFGEELIESVCEGQAAAGHLTEQLLPGLSQVKGD